MNIINEFIVYRVGKSNETLANKNAGDINGIVKFLDTLSKNNNFHENIIFSYKITLYKEPKGEFKHSSSWNEFSHAPNKFGPAVGQYITTSNIWPITWYYFPANGAWSFNVIKQTTPTELDILTTNEKIHITDWATGKEKDEIYDWFSGVSWQDQKRILLKALDNS